MTETEDPALARALEAEAATLAGSGPAALVAAAAALLAGHDRWDSTRQEPPRMFYLAYQDRQPLAPLAQFFAIVGVQAVGLGDAEGCEVRDVARALAAPGRSALFVAADDAGRMLAEAGWIVRQADVPLVTWTGRRDGWRAGFDVGAALVVVDAERALTTPPLGLIAGRANLVEACRERLRGPLGRLAPVHPDAVAKAMQTLSIAAAEA